VNAATFPARRSASVRIGQNIVDAGQVAFVLRIEPIEHLRIEALQGLH
jgi:hypothetical protein